MRVRATRPNYWVGQTYDEWNGRSWAQSANPVNGPRTEKVTGGSPFLIPTYPDQVAPLSSGGDDIQTFYLAQGGPNLVFHADNAQRVYLQAHTVTVTPDGNPWAMALSIPDVVNWIHRKLVPWSRITDATGASYPRLPVTRTSAS